MRALAGGTRADAESRASETDHLSLRLWLRLLTCTTMIERRVRERLRERFDITLARFDLMAQLGRAPNGLRMSELSRRLMVTGGNVTGLTDQLVAENLVVRRAMPGDRRAYSVCLTRKGRRQFAVMAAAHERWIVDLLGDVPAQAREALYRQLGDLKAALARRIDTEREVDEACPPKASLRARRAAAVGSGRG
ncbi:MAG: MarR family winged helix-turn-helix transcriptional regulator [Rudaea sp.]